MTDVEQVRARALAATPGPWQRHGSDVRVEGLADPLFRGRDGSAEVRHQADADAEFVAHAREDVLHLLALLDERGADRPDGDQRGGDRREDGWPD